MHTTFISRRDDEVGQGTFDSIAWAFEVHVKQPDTGEYNSAILHGNEDCPDKIEFWRAANPRYDAPPDYVYTCPEDWHAHYNG